MPTYSIQGPDGKTYSIDGPEGATREQVIYMIERRLREQSKPVGLTGSFMNAATSLGDLPEALKFGMADSTKRQPRKEFLDASAPKGDTTSWDEVKDLASFWEFTKELAGGSAGFIAPAAAAAKAASYLPIVGPYARGIGLATYGLGYLVDQLGTQAQVQQDAIDRGESYAPTSIARAASGAYQSTVLDVVQLGQFSKAMSKFPFVGKLMGDAGEAGAKEASDQLVDAYLAGTLKPAGSVMKGIAKGIGFEVPQEIAQTAIDRLQSRQSLTDDDAMKAYKEAAIGAAILGGPMGALEGGLEYRQAKKAALAPEPAAPPQPAEDTLTATLRPQPMQAPTGPRGLPPPEAPEAGTGTPPPGGGGGGGGGPGAGPGAGPGGVPPNAPFDEDDLNIARDVLLNNKGKKRLTPGGMRYALNAAMRKAGRDGKMKRMDEILRHLTRDGFIRPDADGNVTFGYAEPEPETFDGEAEEITPRGPAPQVPFMESPEDLEQPPAALTPPPSTPPLPPGTQGDLDFGDSGTGGTPPPRGPAPAPAPQGVAPTQEEFNFGEAAIEEAAAKRDLRTQANDWDKQHRANRTDEWFEGGKVNDDARAGFDAALQNGGANLPAHGMSKEGTLSGAVTNLLALLHNGLDPNRRGGRLDYAPLVTQRGSAESQVSTTAGGSAYSDGPFILVGRPGQEFEGKLEGVGAILVNQSHAHIVDALREAVHAIRPDILVEAYSNAGEVAKQLNQTTAPTTTEAAPKRKTLTLGRKPAATTVAPVVEEPVVEDEMTDLGEMDFADAATAGMETEEAYEEGQTVAQQQAQIPPTQAPVVEADTNSSVSAGTGAGVQESVPTETAKPRTDAKNKPAGVGAAGERTSRPDERAPKGKPALTPADRARIAAANQLISTLRYLVKSNRLTPEEVGRIGTMLVQARMEPSFPYKERFPEIRKFLMAAATRAGSDNIETDTEEADIEEVEDQDRNVSREYNEDEAGDYDDSAYEDEQGRPKTLRFSRTADERWYYSAMKRFFEAANKVQATAKEWLGMLYNAQGIKPEELEWSGIEDYLNLMAANGEEKISKEQIAEFLDGHGVNVETKDLTFSKYRNAKIRHQQAKNALNSYKQSLENKYRRLGYEFIFNVENNLIDPSPITTEESDKLWDLESAVNDAWSAALAVRPQFYGISTDQGGGALYREILLTLPGEKRFTEARHFENTQNVLAFIRLDDRVDSQGNTVLFVQEIQSDWGQALRKWGKKGQYEQLPTAVKYLRETAPGSKTWDYLVQPGNYISTVQADTYAEAYDHMVDNLHAVALGRTDVDNAPFVKSTEAWTTLALKKIMAIAVNEGYDKVAFANGVMNSERYGRTISYNKIDYSYDPETNTYDLSLYMRGVPDSYVSYKDVKKEDLIKYLGDQQIVDSVLQRNSERDDLAKPGAHTRIIQMYTGQVHAPNRGMVGYYDNILPKILKKLASKLGGTVKKEARYFGEISSDTYQQSSEDGYATTGEALDVTTLTVDDKLTDSVQKKVPLFRAAAAAATSKMKAVDVQGIVDSVVKDWTNPPSIKVVQSIDDLPANLRKSITFGVDGFYADGTVYLVADNLGGAERVKATLFHEALAHYGLREEFGQKLDPLMDSIYKTNPAMRAAVDKWLKDNPDTYADLGADEQRRAAMEEVFAEQSESGPIKNMGLRAALNRILSMIKDFLRRMGFNVSYSDAEVANVIAKAHDRVISGGKTGLASPGLRFRRTRVNTGANETAEQTIARLQKQLDEAYSADSAFASAIKFRFTNKGFEWLVKRVQNDRRPAKQLEEDLRGSGQLKVFGEGFNNLYTLLTLSAQKAFHYMTTVMNVPLMDMKQSIRDYAKAKGLNMEAALARLHTYVMALHEHERRMAKYVQNVPLNNVQRVRIPGLPEEGTFADQRDFIMRQLYGNPRMSRATAEEYRNTLDDIIAGRYGQALDANGVSAMRDTRGNSVTGLSLDPMSEDYNVIGGYSQAQLAEFRRQYQADRALVDPILTHMKKVQERTIDLNRKANYWSPQVDNLRYFYGWQNYVPFKSRKESKVSADDDKLDLSSDRLGVGGYEYLDYAQSFSGRMTDSENPLLQVMMEAASSAMRAGRHGITQSVVNLNDQGHLKARKLATINFEDRYKGNIDVEEYKQKDTKGKIVFHYMPEGKIEIWAVEEREIAESIRRAYQSPNPIWQATNKMTSFFGHLHTRYNPAFHIYNYIRDSLTNAWLIGSDLSKEARGRYLDQIAKLTVNGGLIKAGKVSRLYANNDVAGIEAMWKNPDGTVKDQFVKDIYDFMRLGGRTSFIQSLSMQKEGDQLLKDLHDNKFKDLQEAGLKWVDIAGDMFELTSRAAAFSAAKAEYRSRGMSEEEANIEAASFTKGLANFEQVGLWGQKLGAFFMFFRPSATGAVRAIDSIRPIWQSEASYLASVRKSSKDTPEKRRKLLEDFRRRKQNAADSLKMLVAAGAALYVLAMAMADDDDAERNEVATDDKALWTRNMRLPLKWLGYEGDNPWLNIPWGFGFGAFAAGGAQTMALLTGGQSVKEYAGNSVNIALDSFLPIPVSRINPFENPGAWFVSSMMPSMMRPVVDFQMNIDSLGRQIYNNRQTKYGDAYTSGLNTPEHINQLSRWMADHWDIDVGPNTLNFWASNYFDAVSRIVGGAYDTTLALKGEKDATVKGMLLPLSSFMGAKSNYDGRKFAEMQKEADDFIAKLNRLENTNPERLNEFLQENPNAYEIKYIYNKMVNGQLRKIAERRKAILSDPNLTPKERRDQATQLNQYYNASKRGLMETMAQYGLDY